MGVMACDRRGCEHIMCDRVILNGSRYICEDCFTELVIAKGSGGHVYFPWTGYFNGLEGVEVHSFRVGDKPPEDSAGTRVSIHRH